MFSKSASAEENVFAVEAKGRKDKKRIGLPEQCMWVQPGITQVEFYT